MSEQRRERTINRLRNMIDRACVVRAFLIGGQGPTRPTREERSVARVFVEKTIPGLQRGIIGSPPEARFSCG